MKLKSCFLSLLMGGVCMTSCCKDDIVTDDVKPEELNSDSAGAFVIVNTRTDETLTIKEISEDIEEIIAHVGDTLKITFNPETEYKDYNFMSTYTLPNNRTGNGKEYKYIITSLKKGTYEIKLNASSSGNTDDTIWNLQANGKFNLKIVPYANIDYTLSCPSTLLSLATPQVTYKGNDGKPVTFTIPESDWKEFVYPESWELEEGKAVVVIGGETVISEPTKTMRWTKHIEYDDFSVIDDEITVVYIPKDNIPTGKVDRVEGLKPHLSQDLEYVDDEGKRYSPIIISIDIDINIGTPGSKSLSEIISGHHNYKGFHVESNGTYDTK